MLSSKTIRFVWILLFAVSAVLYAQSGKGISTSLQIKGTKAITDSTGLATWGLGTGVTGTFGLLVMGDLLTLEASLGGAFFYMLPEDNRIDRMLDLQGAIGPGVSLRLPFGSLGLYLRYVFVGHIVRGTWTGALQEDLFIDHAGEGSLAMDIDLGRRGALGLSLGASALYLLESGDIRLDLSLGIIIYP